MLCIVPYHGSLVAHVRHFCPVTTDYGFVAYPLGTVLLPFDCNLLGEIWTFMGACRGWAMLLFCRGFQEVSVSSTPGLHVW